jgi:hypothetical protein
MSTRIKVLLTQNPDVLVTVLAGMGGTMVTAIVSFLTEYVFSDVQFLISLTIMVFLDSVQKVRKLMREDKFLPVGKKVFSWRNLFFGLMNKFINYSVLLIAVHVLVHFKVNGEVNKTLGWVDIAIYTALMGWEFASIVKNSDKDIKKLIPKNVWERLSPDKQPVTDSTNDTPQNP